MAMDHERFTVRVSDEAIQALLALQQETGLSRSKIVDILACKADSNDLLSHQHLWRT